MPTYYEILKIQPQATPSEIQTALDQEYNNWRRLVTHHDPAIVEQANQSLRLLEQIRNTLTDPSARNVYDTGLGIKGPVAGLADPEAILRASPLLPNVAPMTSKQNAALVATDSWICSKCQTPNRIGLKFCSKCGAQIGCECVKCRQVISINDTFCPHCGVDIAKEQAKLIAQQKEIERQKAELEHQKEMEEAARLTRQREIAGQRAEELSRYREKEQRNIRIIVIVFVLVIIYVIIAAIFKLPM